MVAEAPPTHPRRRVWDVGKVSRSLADLLERETPGMWVRGEMVNLRFGRDGRVMFFALADAAGADARLDAFSFVTELAAGFTPADGVLVEGYGRLELSRRDGGVRLRLTHVEPAGEGELLRQIAERARRLGAEGLFDDGRKRPLPFLPRVVGLVTARGGAALDDVRRRLEARCPVGLVIAYAAMQGPAAAAEVAAAVRLLDADPRVDVIVVARGGGSLQDLMPFSDEGLVRAIVASATPVVSAVGHMRDTTLVCRAADSDAATPTAAVDLVVPERALLADDLAATGRRLVIAARRRLERAQGDLAALAARPPLARPRSLIDPAAARNASLQRDLGRGLRGAAERAGARAGEDGRRLGRGLRQAAAAHATRLAELDRRRRRAAGACGRDAAGSLSVLAARLGAADPTRPLATGFALVRDPSGRAVVGASAALSARRVTMTFADGTVAAEVTGTP